MARGMWPVDLSSPGSRTSNDNRSPSVSYILSSFPSEFPVKGRAHRRKDNKNKKEAVLGGYMCRNAYR